MSEKVSFCAQEVSRWGFWCSWETFGFWRGEAFRISGGTLHTWGKSLAICKPKTQKSQKFATRKQVPITWITFQAPRTHCIVPHRGGDEQNQHNKQREEKRGKKAATVLLSHIVSAWTFGTWGIYTLVVDSASTYLGGVYQWSRWLMA